MLSLALLFALTATGLALILAGRCLSLRARLAVVERERQAWRYEARRWPVAVAEKVDDTLAADAPPFYW